MDLDLIPYGKAYVNIKQFKINKVVNNDVVLPCLHSNSKIKLLVNGNSNASMDLESAIITNYMPVY